jgi:hypothetical protein
LISTKKDNFWKIFWPDWDSTYPKLDTDELQEELVDEEKAFAEATTDVKQKNLAATKGHRRRKAKCAKLPLPSARLNELRARNSDHAVCILHWTYVPHS